jgi:DNA helicase MCM9
VEVCGVVLRQWGAMHPGVRCQLTLVLQATSVAAARERRAAADVTPAAAAAFAAFWAEQRARGRPLEGRNKIVAALCPQLCGLFTPKLASLLMLIGGVAREGEGGGGARVRGELHLLLVGDPGTGKSALQKAVSRLAPRAVLASGGAASAAGLTAAAVRDGGGWSLEAGALVLADGGVCCIDEFDAVKEGDRAALHEAMEQQTCSVAKAGLVATLRTRAAVFGTCNPAGHRRYNPRKPLGDQVNLSGPLLSRFDVVLLLLDEMRPAWDEAVADHILAAHQRRGDPGATGGSPPPPAARGAGRPAGAQPAPGAGAGAGAGGAWSLEVLRQYVAWVKAEFQPVLTPEAEEVLGGYYALRRGATGRAASRTTVRLLESLVRVAQAHARLMARRHVALQDAVVAVAVVEGGAAVAGEGAGGGGGAVGGVRPGAAGDHFPEDPDGEYAALEAAVLAAVRGEEAGGGALLAW